MSDIDTALDLLRSANPVSSVDVLDRDELAASVVACERLIDEASQEQSGAVTVVTRRPVGDPVPRGRGFRPVLVVAAAWAVLVMTVATIAFLVTWASDPPEPADRPTTTVPVEDPTPTTTVAADGTYDVVVDRDLVYWTDGETTLTVDVFHPAEGTGPWPVVVAYPYYSAGASDASTARAMAERGAVAFAPVTVTVAYDDPALYIDGFLFDRGACAVGFAQAHAAEYGGDPTRTTVLGTGGGEHQALWAALGLERDDVCDEPIRYAPVGLVVGMPQLLFQVDYWDETVADPESNALDTLDRYWNPERWQFSDELRGHIWVTADNSNIREIDTQPTDESWIHSRDVTGTLVEDLDAFGAFDDGVIRYDDNARLLYLVMRRAGIPVTLDQMATSSWDGQSGQYDRMWSIISAS